MTRFHVLRCFFLTISIIAVKGYQTYNEEAQMCCDGSLYENDESLTGCCGSTPYNSSENACCGQTLYDFPNKNSTNYACCYDKDWKFGIAYDPATHQCCNGVPLVMDDPDLYYRCCGDKLAIYNEEICCGGEIWQSEPGLECCGGEALYNDTTQHCCSIYTIKEGEDWTEEYLLHDIEVSENRDDLACCVLSLYDRETQVCCDGAELRERPSFIGKYEYPACCGDSFITNYTSQLCHNEKIIERPSSRHYMCGDQLYDYSDQSCCADAIIYKDNSGLSCCYEAKMTYNPETEYCHGNNQIRPRPTRHHSYCGEQLFNFTNQSCCADTMVYDDNSDISCCYGANSTYNIKTQICCGEEVVTLTDEDVINERLSCCYA